MEGNDVYELAVAWTFIVLRLAVFVALIWYAVYEYRRWSKKSQSNNDPDLDEDINEQH